MLQLMRTLLHVLAACLVWLVDWLADVSRPADATHAPIVRFIVKHPLATAGALVVVGGIAAALVIVSGIVPIKASSGHWAITARLLDFAKVRSVVTHSIGIRAPDLDDEALILRGAGHYDIGCYPCHGGPDGGVPPVMDAMTPPPPELTSERVSRWKAEQLFSIVKHGIKFTGMPAWPVQQRDDEIWAVVAFLRTMPGLDGARYRRLASGDAGISPDAAPDLPSAGDLIPPRAVRDLCWRCHGVDGTGRGPGSFPALAGQRGAYLLASLQAFADRTRFSGVMAEIAARLSDDDMREIAAYYERLPPRITTAAVDPAAIAHGASIVTRGISERDIPACVECHGPAIMPKNPAYPILAGQHERYLGLQLELLKQRRRGGSPRVNLMHVVVDRLDPRDIRSTAQYYASIASPAAGQSAPASQP